MIPLLIVLAGVVLAAVFTVTGWIIRSLIELKNGMAAIHAQYGNNGGSTIRDAVDRIEDKVDEAGTKLNEHLIVAARSDAMLEAHLAQPATQINVHPS